MPRPKVKPEDRQRSSKACLPCKTSKIRCDSQLPCVACVRRDRASQCVYQDTPGRRIPGRARDGAATYRPRNPASQSRSRLSPSPEHENPYTSPVSTNDALASPPELPGSQMMMSAKGEKVYVGETASLSFLHFVRQILRQFMGPSAFTENETSNVMLEADIEECTTQELEETSEQKKALVLSYFAASSAISTTYTKDELFASIDRWDQLTSGTPTTRAKREELASLYLVFAIGRQCRGIDPLDQIYATRDFARGQQIAFEGMLMDPSLNMVRLFLLMAFYMLGACRRNASFMYLGVAAKAATALGLHSLDRSVGLRRDEFSHRSRIWKSLYTLELVVSSILGRPSGLPPIHLKPATLKKSTSQTKNLTEQASDAMYDVCMITEELVHKLDSDHIVQPDAAEEILNKLHRWSQLLPPELRQFLQPDQHDPQLETRELAVGYMHLSCAYYFAIILLTRPFLISDMMIRLHLKSADGSSPGKEVADRGKIPQLAQVCVDAAIMLADMSYTAMTSGHLLYNMCLLKAYAFAAGLILGFSLFAQQEDRYSKEQSLNGVREVLKKLSESSPQARQYYDILTAFSEAVSRHHQKISADRRRLSNKYVSQMMSMAPSSSSAEAETTLQPPSFSYGASSSNNNNISRSVDGSDVTESALTHDFSPDLHVDMPVYDPSLADGLMDPQLLWDMPMEFPEDCSIAGQGARGPIWMMFDQLR